VKIEVITALISGLCVAVPSVLTTILSNISNNKKAEETKNLTIYRIDQLEKKVDKHNNLVERMYKIENRVSLLEDDAKINGGNNL